MTKADSDYAISSSVEEDNDTAKETNEGETRTVDKHILDTGLENDKHMATSLNRNQSISNGNIPGIKITGIESSLNTKSVAVDGIKTVKYTNGDVLGTVIKNGEGSLNTKRDDEVQQLEKDGLIPDTISENNQDESLKNASIDRGWAWVILLAAYLQSIILGGFMKVSGIFFIAYQERFKSSASQTSLILTIQNMTMSFTGILVMTVGMKYMTARTCILIGALLLAIFYVVTAFVENFGVLYFTVGFITGIGGALTYLPIVSTINTYFNKYRGLANSVFTSGSSLGGLIFGPIYTALFEEYGYTGTFLILGGIFFNIMITGMLMRPIESYTKRNKTRVYGDEHNKDETKEKLMTDNGFKAEGINERLTQSVDTPVVNENRKSSKENVYVSENETWNHEQSYLNDGVCSEVMVKRIQSTIDDEQAISDILHKRTAFRNFNRSVSHDPESLIKRHFPSPSLKRAKLGHHASHSLKKTSSESIEGPRKWTFSENSHSKVIHGMIESISRSRVALYTGGDVTYSSMANISVAEHEEEIAKREFRSIERVTKSRRSNSKTSNIGRVIVDFFRTVFDISLLRSNVFIHYLCLAFLILPGSILPAVYFAPYAKEIGITNSQIGTMFPIIGCLDMISRIAVGFIADKKWMRSTSILCVTAIIVGTMSHLMRFFTSYGTMVIFVVIIGITAGAYISLYAVVILEHIGLDRFKGALGWATMCHGVTNAIYFPITGALRDETGTYFASFHLIGVTMYLAAVLSFLLPYTCRRHRVT